MLAPTARRAAACFTAVLLLATALCSLAVDSASAATNLISNGSFEGTVGKGSLAGWGGSSGTLSLVTGNGGGHGARLTATGAPAQMYAYTTTKPVKGASAGAVYSLAGQIQGGTSPTQVCLVLKELKGTSATGVGSAQSCLTTSSAWQAFPTVGYTVKTSGDSITVNVLQKPAGASASFSIDNIVLSSGVADKTPPSVPGNVTAAANGSSSVIVSWSPSTDDSGTIAGYQIFRDGTLIKTVAASPTSFTDTGLLASTTYGYTVAAVDPSGNTSAQSSPAATATTDVGPPPPASPCGSMAGQPHPVYDHVVMIMEENLSYGNWLNNASLPYTNQLASQCASATNFTALTHPSQQNYMGTLTGSVPAPNTNVNDDNLLHQLGVARLSWAGLNESMPTACDHTTKGLYKVGHNPAVFLNDLGPAGDNSCATSDIPFSTTTFSPSMLKSFTWITPNICDDMHWTSGCPETQAQAQPYGDSWLANFLPQILNSPDYAAGKTLVIVTFDEGIEGSGNTGIDCTTAPNIDSVGCHIPFVAISPYITPGTTDATRLSLYSITAALENMWGLPLLGNAQTATPLGPSFGF
jgi:phosphatidylinositol-3-phosphatase